MPNLDDLVKNIDKLIASLETEVPRVAAIYAQEAIALSIVRIHKDGAKPGAAYSVEPMYASKSVFNQKGAFKPIGKGSVDRIKQEKAKGKSGRRKAADKLRDDGKERTTMYLEEGYKELRAIQGLPTDVVNLDYTSRLRQNIKVLKVENRKVYAAAGIVGAVDGLEKKKLAGQHKRYGNFLTPSANDLKIINNTALESFRKLVVKTLAI